MPTLSQTKFCPPLPHRDVIPRSTLIRRLLRDLPAVRLVLLSAPAGYGKTTLLSAIPEVLADYHLAWFSLDRADNDPVRFLSGLGEALAVVHPDLQTCVEEQTAAMAGMIAGFPLQQAIVPLINTMLSLSVPPAILVLDDLHEITNPLIYAALDDLIENLPPRLHLILSTRREPPLHLTRLRARRQMVELTTADLRFDLEESSRFFNQILNMGLSETEIAILQQKTEGWQVGLVLLTNRLRNLPPPGERCEFFTHLDPIDSQTFHYLADEVLAGQPDHLRSFLLEISILHEITPSICQRLTNRTDSAELLEELYRRNLFLVRVRDSAPPDEPIYRFHALFAGFLQRELKKQDQTHYHILHLRASGLENTPGRAVEHLIAARQWQSAACQIEGDGEAFLEQGLQETVLGWIHALPGDLVQQRYHLLFLKGLSELLKGDLEPARVSLESSLLTQTNEIDPHTHGQILTSLASVAFIRAEFARSAELIREAEIYTGRMQERLDFLMLRASLALFWESDWERAGQDLREALTMVQEFDEPRLWYRFALYLGPEFTVLPGVLDLLESFCTTARQRCGAQINPLRLGIEDTLAVIHLRRGRLTRAIETGRDALQTKERLGGYTFLGINAAIAMTSACMGIGNYPAAEETLQQILKQAQNAELNRALTGGGLYPHGKLLWLQGRYEEAQSVYLQMAALHPRLNLVEVLQKMLGGLLEIAARRYAAAEVLLLEAVRLQTREWVSGMYGSARLLLALLYLRWDKPRLALESIDAVLAVCEQNQTPGVILQDMPLAIPLLRLAVKNNIRAGQARSLLDQMGIPLEEETSPSGLLTERQMEILRLMAAGYSNQAIADSLILSLATVKSHVGHIMNRLGASSRTEAVACARRQRLLD